MVEDWNGCRKGACELWARLGKDTCPLYLDGRILCQDTGHFFIPKKTDPEVEYEGVKLFSILDMAQAGICHEKISRFFRKYFSTHDNNFANHSGTGMKYEAWLEDLESCDLLEDLKNHGFIKRKVPDFNKFDLVTWSHSHRGAMIGIIQESIGRGRYDVLCLREDDFKKVFEVKGARLTKVKIP